MTSPVLTQHSSSALRTIGVLGGMGPAATVDFYGRLIRLTPAARDQDHPPVVIWADPSVPDRVAALRGTGPSPVPWLLRGATILQGAGAEVLAVPCNTVHPFLPEALQELSVDWVDMVTSTVEEVRQADPVVRVGLLATAATVEHGMYQRAFADAGIETVPPPEEEQQRLLEIIAAVKAGAPTGTLIPPYLRLLEGLARAGCGVAVAACTEVSIVVAAAGSRAAAVPVTDASDALAREALRRAGVSPRG